MCVVGSRLQQSDIRFDFQHIIWAAKIDKYAQIRLTAGPLHGSSLSSRICLPSLAGARTSGRGPERLPPATALVRGCPRQPDTLGPARRNALWSRRSVRRVSQLCRSMVSGRPMEGAVVELVLLDSGRNKECLFQIYRWRRKPNLVMPLLRQRI